MILWMKVWEEKKVSCGIWLLTRWTCHPRFILKKKPTPDVAEWFWKALLSNICSSVFTPHTNLTDRVRTSERNEHSGLHRKSSTYPEWVRTQRDVALLEKNLKLPSKCLTHNLNVAHNVLSRLSFSFCQYCWTSMKDNIFLSLDTDRNWRMLMC